VALGVVGGHEELPLRQLADAGVRVVLAADDPLLFGASLVDQYAVVRDVIGYSRRELAALARTSVTASTMPDDIAKAVLTDIDAWATSG
jgi:adenosine deaminase